MFSKTKNTIVMALVGIGLLITMIGLIINYYNYQYHATVTAERERLTIVANCLDMYFNTKLIGLKVLADCPNVSSLDPDQAQGDLMAAAKTLDVPNVALYDPDGNLICDYYSNPRCAHSAFDAPDFTEALQMALAGQAGISGRNICNNLESAYVNILVPVAKKDKVVAVLAAYVPISDISSVLRVNFPESQYVCILDGNGHFIYHPRLAELYPENPSLKDQTTSLVYNKNGVIEFNSNLDGIDKLLIYTDLNNTNWRVATAMPLNALHARVLSKSLDNIRNLLLLAVCFGLLYGVWRQAKSHKREREQLKLERMMCVNQLAAGIAHEIRNPLTSIKGFIQLMARRTDKPATPEHLEIILSEIGRIDNLITEFQMLASPLKEPVFKKVNICKLIEDIVFLMESQLYAKNIKLQIQSPDSLCFAFGDISQLKQVFINLLKNAIEAVPQGGSIIIDIAQQQDSMAVTVENNGDGIPADVMEKLGTPFFTTKENGTGLGLSVCYSIVQNHGGKIKVFSQSDTRTAFTVLLPVAADEVDLVSGGGVPPSGAKLLGECAKEKVD